MRVLLAEDNKPLVRILKRGLENESYIVDVAEDGEEADYLARSGQYDAIMLDVALPKIDGVTLLEMWRREGVGSQVMLLSAQEGQAACNWLECGANDFLAMPFRVDDVIARLRIMVHSAQAVKETVIRCHDLEIDLTTRTVRRAGQTIHLTPREFALLQFLAMHRGKVVTRAMVWAHLYDSYDENTSNVVDVYIRYLRIKIDKGHDKPLILTRWGEGYMLRSDD